MFSVIQETQKMTNDHSDRTHAALGGSTAERWLNCPGSVFYIRDLPKEIPSEAALEGTKAHEYAEVILEGFLSYKLDGVPQDPLLVLNDELFTLGETYKDLVWKNVLQESITDKSYALEDKLVLDKHLEMFGFVDFWAIYIDDHGKKTGVIVDFKSGYTEITVKNNAQLAFYACALREEIVRKGKDLDRVRAIIIQPKVHEPYKEVNFTAKQLDVWRTKFFKAAEQIFVKKKATFKVGSWCKFCPAQSICSVYAKKLQSELSLKLIEPDEELLPLPDKLTNEQLIAVVSKDGDGFDLEKYPYYENRFILVARNAKAVDIYSKDEEKIMPSEIIGGAEGRILVTPIITAKGVSFKLELVQFIKDDGTRYGGANRDLSSFLTALDEDSKEEDEDEDDDDSEDDNDEDEDEDEEKEEHDDEEIPTKLAAKGKGRPKRKLD